MNTGARGLTEDIPATLRQRGALRFWSAALVIGASTGLIAAGLTRLLGVVQRFVWRASPTDSLLDAVSRASALYRIAVLSGAGALTGLGQVLLSRLSSGNGIDVTEAIAFRAGRLPRLRTLGSAVLSVVIVAMGTSLGREGAPKQAGAVIANEACDRLALSDEQRRLLVACGSGAGMSAAYGVPLGGSLFALEVMRGMLALRMVLPALLTSLVAAGVSWWFLPNAPTYPIGTFESSASFLCWSIPAGAIAGVVSVGYVRAVTAADRHKPRGAWRIVAPIIALTAIGCLAIPYPQILGNGKDIVTAALGNAIPAGSLVVLLLLKPTATVLCLGSGAPGGLFTPSLSVGALLGSLLGYGWSSVWPGTPPAMAAVAGAAAVLAATTQGPLSAIVLVMELTGRDRSLVLPMFLAVITATMTARTIEPRSIYEARLSDEQVRARRAPR